MRNHMTFSLPQVRLPVSSEAAPSVQAERRAQFVAEAPVDTIGADARGDAAFGVDQEACGPVQDVAGDPVVELGAFGLLFVLFEHERALRDLRNIRRGATAKRT